ncbi:MAG: Lrp/AsnC family transcriptional regulator [Nanoarchaeota archaeon]|nr:Lrp/AsnC family transcriptional regulator [Nanoarchaeota archaeon]
MDKIDAKIIEALKKNSRTPFLQIAKSLDVSEGTVRNRVNDMVKEGVIKKFTVVTEGEIFVIVGLETETRTETKKIVSRLKNFGIGEIFEVTGRFDIICKVSSSKMDDMNNTIELVRSIPGVAHTETFTVLKQN